MKKILLRYWTVFFIISLIAKNSISASEIQAPCKEGNFSLPPSQHPAPLVGFGETIIDQYQLQFFLNPAVYINANDEYFIDITPSLSYGITNDLTVYFSVPFAGRYQSEGKHSSGIEDIYLQFEYAIWAKNNPCSADQATILAAVNFPTGSTKKNPPTGFGSYSYFIGGTYNHTGKEWFAFTSYGALLTTTSSRTRFGNQYFYQYGVGRNIATPPGWLLAWMVEVDGTFYERNKFKGMIDPNSGGNVIYVTPSLWASTEKFILQFGAGYAPIENSFGNQPRDNFLISMFLIWTLH